ncbi:FAD-binding protein [soil metagenome]
MSQALAGSTPDFPWFNDECPTSIPVSGARTVLDVNAERWDEICDVLVVGCGLSGTSAALRAAEDPSLSVLAVDRGEGGGASALSGGVLYLGGTRVQKDCGVEDSAENMAAYLAHETGTLIKPETVRRFAEQSASFIPWLESHGARFGGPLSEAKTSYPGTKFLYYSGNEKTLAARKLATPAPRGHRTMPANPADVTAMSGGELMRPLLASLASKSNIRLSPETTVRRLILDGDGRVVGAEMWRLPAGPARRHRFLMRMGRNMMATILGASARASRAATKIEQESAKLVRVRVKRGVVLSAGGFIFNPTMLANAAPKYVGIAGIGTIGDDGSGIKLGASVGGATARMDMVSAWRFLYPPATWVKGIAIGPDGRRIVNEEEYGARTGEAIFERNAGLGWIIVDRPLQEAVEKDAKDPDLLSFQKMTTKAALRLYTKSGATLERLADKIGVPADALVATVEAYNRSIRDGEPDAFGKSDTLRKPIETGPFFATDISYKPKLNPISGVTMGGLTVNEETGAVRGADGAAIPGLYAAGRNAVGLCSNFYVSGLSLADCVFSGWRAADSLKSTANV